MTLIRKICALALLPLVGFPQIQKPEVVQITTLLTRMPIPEKSAWSDGAGRYMRLENA